MSSNFFNSILSVFFEAGGQGISRGGKGIALMGLRKIGWAKDGEQKGRLQGLKIGGHKFGQGKKEIPQVKLVNQKKETTKPKNLFGRQSFQGTNTISGNPEGRWNRHGNSDSKSYSNNPRGFIKF